MFNIYHMGFIREFQENSRKNVKNRQAGNRLQCCKKSYKDVK